VLPISQRQTQQVMTSQIMSHIKIFNTDLLYACDHFIVKNGKKNLALMMILIRYDDDIDSGLFFGHPVYK